MYFISYSLEQTHLMSCDHVSVLHKMYTSHLKSLCFINAYHIYWLCLSVQRDYTIFHFTKNVKKWEAA